MHMRMQMHTHMHALSQVYELLMALEPEADGTNFEQVGAALTTLTEFVQGNSTRKARPDAMAIVHRFAC